MERGDVELVKLLEPHCSKSIRQIAGKYYYNGERFDAIEIDRMTMQIKLSKLVVWKPREIKHSHPRRSHKLSMMTW